MNTEYTIRMRKGEKMLSVIECHGCVHWTPAPPQPGDTSVQHPCIGCYITSGGMPSNYEPQKIALTTKIGAGHGK